MIYEKWVGGQAGGQPAGLPAARRPGDLASWLSGRVGLAVISNIKYHYHRMEKMMYYPPPGSSCLGHGGPMIPLGPRPIAWCTYIYKSAVVWPADAMAPKTVPAGFRAKVHHQHSAFTWEALPKKEQTDSVMFCSEFMSGLNLIFSYLDKEGLPDIPKISARTRAKPTNQKAFYIIVLSETNPLTWRGERGGGEVVKWSLYLRFQT